MDGIITFNTREELMDIINNLTDGDYRSKRVYIQENFERARKYAYDNDQLFEKYLKNLIR